MNTWVNLLQYQNNTEFFLVPDEHRGEFVAVPEQHIGLLPQYRMNTEVNIVAVPEQHRPSPSVPDEHRGEQYWKQHKDVIQYRITTKFYSGTQ
jgi:hypothetical protein